MKNRDIQIAFREKLALCAIIAFMCGVMLFFIVGFGRLICPKTNVMSAGEISTHRTLSDPYVIVSGKYYIINDIVQTHVFGGTQAVPGTTFEVSLLRYP